MTSVASFSGVDPRDIADAESSGWPSWSAGADCERRTAPLLCDPAALTEGLLTGLAASWLVSGIHLLWQYGLWQSPQQWPEDSATNGGKRKAFWMVGWRHASARPSQCDDSGCCGGICNGSRLSTAVHCVVSLGAGGVSCVESARRGDVSADELDALSPAPACVSAGWLPAGGEILSSSRAMSHSRCQRSAKGSVPGSGGESDRSPNSLGELNDP